MPEPPGLPWPAQGFVPSTSSPRPSSTWPAPSVLQTIETEINLGYGAVLQTSQRPERRVVRRSYEQIEEQLDFAVGS